MDQEGRWDLAAAEGGYMSRFFHVPGYIPGHSLIDSFLAGMMELEVLTEYRLPFRKQQPVAPERWHRIERDSFVVLGVLLVAVALLLLVSWFAPKSPVNLDVTPSQSFAH